MAKKKRIPKPATESRKNIQSRKRVSQSQDACPQGGDHQWEQEDGGTFCKKCHEAPLVGKHNAGPAELTEAAKGQQSQPAGAKKLSAIDAAAKVLADSKEPLNAKQIIEVMAAQGLWTSPGGKTPHATLYSAIITEIRNKGKQSRFVKTDRGHFAVNV